MVSRVVQVVRNIKGTGCRKVTVKVKTFDYGRPEVRKKVEFLVDSGVTKSLLREEDWNKSRMPANEKGKLVLKNCHTKLTTYGMRSRLSILGRMKCRMQAECGEYIVLRCM